MLTRTARHAAAPTGPALAAAPDDDALFDELRTREFARLDETAHAYLDYTGSALYPESLVTRHAAMLRESVLGNPHSENPASLASSALIAEARARVLRFLDADPAEYLVCFTANASGAVRLVAEGWPFGARTPLVLAADNHNSVNGVREYAARAGAPVHYLPLDAELRLDDAAARLRAIAARGGRGGGGLLAYPAQSNFSGVRHSLALVRAARAAGYAVLLDAAAYVPTSTLSLRAVPADFVALSFYKMFGYPTGLGALVARREAAARLRRPWFAGGTVEYVSVQHRTHSRLAGAEGFEDGTPSFLAIGAVCAGLDFLDGVGLARVGRRTAALAERLERDLRALRHRTGLPLARVYGPAEGRGAVVTFNVLDAAGAVVPYAEVEERARRAHVSVRGGCFCNPGAAEAAFGFPADETARCLEATRRAGWSIPRFAACMRGRAVGAIRASLGLPSNEHDVRRLVDVVASFTG
jgi:selenocysteine lyase/cysteine desulfurase